MQHKGRLIVMIALLAALAAIVVYEWQQLSGAPGGRETAAASGRAGAARRAAVPASAAVPAVRLDALQAARSQPAPPAGGRNLFQFQPKLPPPPPPGVVAPGAPGGSAAGGAVAPAGPPPPPPIPFKFIGIVEAPNQKLAVLADNSTKDVFYGREGDIVDGRYRILRIGVESIEMAYVDGRGRQTIRLTGS